MSKFILNIIFIEYEILACIQQKLPPGKYICAYGIARKGFWGPRRSFRPLKHVHWRCIYIVYEFWGYTSAFPVTLESTGQQISPGYRAPTCTMSFEEEMRGQACTRRAAECEAAPTSLVAVTATGSPILHWRSEDLPQHEGSIRPLSEGILRDSLPSERWEKTAVALGHAAQDFALCPASARPLPSAPCSLGTPLLLHCSSSSLVLNSAWIKKGIKFSLSKELFLTLCPVSLKFE